MEQDDIEKMDEMMEEERFAELLQGSLVKPVRFSPGQKVKAKIVKISTEWYFLIWAVRARVTWTKKEILDEEGNLSAKEGDVMEAYFLSADSNELRFTTRIAGGEAGRRYLEEAWRAEYPWKGWSKRKSRAGSKSG